MVWQISASQFKARCLGLMDDVARSGEALVITKNGQSFWAAPRHPPRRRRRGAPGRTLGCPAVILLDTHVLLWLDRDDAQLGHQARKSIALQAVELDAFHADPADRFIAASAIWHRATLLTADQAILNWPGSLQRLDGRH